MADAPRDRQRTALEALTAIAVLATLCLAILSLPGLSAPATDARYAVLVIVAGVGLPLLVRVYRGGARIPVVLAVAFGAWTSLSTALSSRPWLAVWGSYDFRTGLIFVLALIGAWALGSVTGAGGTEIVEKCLVAGVIVNCAFAVTQMFVDLDRYGLGTSGARATGLFGNPVYLSEFLAGGFWLVALRQVSQPRRWWAGTLLVACAIELSGSRFALGLMVPALVLVVVSKGAGPGAAVAAVAVAGLVAGAAVAHTSGGTSATARATSSTGIGVRLATWEQSRHAIAERPIAGFGPGRYQAATSRFTTLEIARFGNGTDSVFADAHNLVIEYTVTTGLVGVVLLLSWLTSIFARLSLLAPLPGFALFLLAMHLVEPQGVGTTPLAFLALGAASPLVARRRACSQRSRAGPEHSVPSETVNGAETHGFSRLPHTNRRSRILGATCRAAAALVSLVVAVVLVAGSKELARASSPLSFAEAYDAAHAAKTLLPPWPDTDVVTANIHFLNGLAANDPVQTNLGLVWLERAVRADPTEVSLWNRLAGAERRNGSLTCAQLDYEMALRQDPWSVLALSAQAAIDNAEGRTSDSRQLEARAHRVTSSIPEFTIAASATTATGSCAR